MIIRFLTEALMQVSFISLIAFLFLSVRSKENFKRIGLFSAVYIVSQIVLVLPRLIPSLDFIYSDWNWEGKIFGTLFGLSCYYLFRQHFSENDFFTFRQSPDSLKFTIPVSVGVILLMSTIYYFIAESPFHAETLAFQLLMPGPDEEIMFRGVLLGLLLSALPDKVKMIGNPAVLLTAVLFGFLHAFTLNKDFIIGFEPVYFLHTGIGGYVFGWLAVKSRSLVLPVLVHALTNFLAALATMI